MREEKKKRFINRAERETQKPESWDQALNLQSLFLSAPPPPQSHVKNYTAAPASKQLQSGVCEWRLCRTGWHCSLTFGEVLTIYSTGFIFRWTGSKSWACSQSPLSVPHDHNYIKYNHSDPNCQLITVAEVNQWVIDSERGRASNGEGERLREIRGKSQGLRLGSVASPMAPCQCHYVDVRSGAVSPQTVMTYTFKRVSGGHPRLTQGECQALTHGAWWGDKFVKRRISASLPHVSHYPSQSRLTLACSSPAASLPS